MSCLMFTSHVFGQQVTNKPERVNWFQDLGFGMFIHWNVDGTLGCGHQSLVGRSI